MSTTQRSPRTARRGAVLVAALVALLGLSLAACGGSGSSDQASPSGQQAAPKTLTVSAAASLTDVYQQLAQQFQAANPGTTVKFNFGGSDQLAQQVVQGAPADVLATASSKTMQTAVQAGKIQGEPIVYATNQPEIAVAPTNPKQIASFTDLNKPGVTTVVCAPAVPCGAAATAAEKAANVTLHPVSEEQDVKSVLTRVETGNADAGVVYVTDVKSAQGKVQGVTFPQATAQGVVQTYPIGVVAGSPNAQLAQSWVSFVTGPQGKAALQQAGFTTK
ncbi:molybdate ABC transporter substrate-binding protein [Actinomycetospora sp. TBRC 11914]|uniref:molybdate ABC transporter substrate-binding protein n=1 Tax=Actinomycetospora sp. TBRC 11914 TaxID=2729387 RepID=UPI00145FB8B5|nr:molybdate ABC transporter substrate-binding protein [Actinomycetospora sp. TBRC 11914]NMO88921.1 molybdate ABC transporter substrate-binding protein [Actinomycetospora sp. TBRC 11914]